jgi:hypothetical protein
MQTNETNDTETETEEITPMARQIYRHLAKVVRAGTASITYRDLAEAVSKKIPTHPRSSKLHEGLTEVTQICRKRELPAVTAIVWRAGAKRPSDGYFGVAYPRSRSFKAQLAAWREEHAQVLREAPRLPPVL